MSKGKSLDEAKAKKAAMKAESKGQISNTESKDANSVSKIIFACDAGMGSSAMGATKFAKRINTVRSDIVVKNSAIDSIPSDADIVVCQSSLADRAVKQSPEKAQIIQLDNFLGDPALDQLYEKLSSSNSKKSVPDKKQSKSKQIKMLKKGVKLGKKANDKTQAIQAAGELLKNMGCVDDDYIKAMHQRESQISTYLGMGVAIPHGTSEAKSHVKKSGIVMLQYPDGVSFGNEKAYLVFGIAGIGDEHLDLLAKISTRLEDEKIVEKLKSTDDIDFVVKTFNS